jgi:hypothetical protein
LTFCLSFSIKTHGTVSVIPEGRPRLLQHLLQGVSQKVCVIHLLNKVELGHNQVSVSNGQTSALVGKEGESRSITAKVWESGKWFFLRFLLKAIITGELNPN